MMPSARTLIRLELGRNPSSNKEIILSYKILTNDTVLAGNWILLLSFQVCPQLWILMDLAGVVPVMKHNKKLVINIKVVEIHPTLGSLCLKYVWMWKVKQYIINNIHNNEHNSYSTLFYFFLIPSLCSVCLYITRTIFALQTQKFLKKFFNFISVTLSFIRDYLPI